MNAPAQLTIDIWSDVMCPWCVIGFKHLERALDSLKGEVEAEIRWHPFELNRDMPPEGEDMAAHIARKYGVSPGQEVFGGMEGVAGRAGYSLRYTGKGEAPAARIWNTLLAHKLLRWALEQAGPEAQTRLKCALFDAHFQQRRNVSDRAILADIAQGVGLDRDGALAALDDESLAEAVRAEEAEALEMGIAAVPMMVINRKFMIPGAQESDVYRDVLRKAVARG